MVIKILARTSSRHDMCVWVRLELFWNPNFSPLHTGKKIDTTVPFRLEHMEYTLLCRHGDWYSVLGSSGMCVSHRVELIYCVGIQCSKFHTSVYIHVTSKYIEIKL